MFYGAYYCYFIFPVNFIAVIECAGKVWVKVLPLAVATVSFMETLFGFSGVL
jgi:hypothetical protein